MTSDRVRTVRAPSVARGGRLDARRWMDALEGLAVCPACTEGAFQAVWLPSTLALMCSRGCRGRRIAIALGLAALGWPEVRP